MKDADSQGKLGDEAADVLRMPLIYRQAAGVDIEAAMQRKWLHWREKSA